MTLKKDQIISLLFLVLAVVFLIFINDIEMPKNLTEPGPKIMPFLSIVLMIICCIGVFFESVKNKGESEKPFLSKDGWKRLIFIASLLIAYALGLMYFGFLITTPFMAFALINMFSGEKRISILIGVVSSMIITTSIYLLFSVGFNVMLPPGILFE